MADFNQAVLWMQEEKKIRRKSWENPNMYIFPGWANKFHYHTSKEDHDGPSVDFKLEDFEATDWEIYCEKHDWINEHKLSCRPMYRPCGILGCIVVMCKNCGLEKPKEIKLERRSFSERIAYLKAQFDIGDINEDMYKIQISAVVGDLK